MYNLYLYLICAHKIPHWKLRLLQLLNKQSPTLPDDMDNPIAVIEKLELYNTYFILHINSESFPMTQDEFRHFFFRTLNNEKHINSTGIWYFLDATNTPYKMYKRCSTT